jgi:hypothetical protein
MILGLLFAPRSGSDSRTWLASQGRQVARRAKILDPSAVRDILRRRGVLGLRDALRQSREASRR